MNGKSHALVFAFVGARRLNFKIWYSANRCGYFVGITVIPGFTLNDDLIRIDPELQNAIAHAIR